MKLRIRMRGSVGAVARWAVVGLVSIAASASESTGWPRVALQPGGLQRGGAVAAAVARPAAAPVSASSEAEDFAQRIQPLLGELDAALQAQREAAQRELARALQASDGARLAVSLEDLGPEARARVAEALDAREALLPLAAELSSGSGAAAEVGGQAVRAHLERWRNGLAPRRAGGQELLERLRRAGADRPAVWVRLPRGLPLEVLAEALAAALPEVPLVVDPRLARRLDARAPEPDGWWLGPVEDVALQALRARGLELDAAEAKASEPLEPPRLCYLRATTAAFSEVGTPAQELLGWIEALGGADEGRARAAAEALAHCGWPGGTAILEARARAGDAPALWGLVAAAARGRVAPALREPDMHSAVLLTARAEFEAGARGGELSVRQLLAALAQIGPVGAGGADLWDAGWGAVRPPLDQASRWEQLRLAVAARGGFGRPSLDARTAELMADARAPLELRRAALHAAARCRLEAVGAGPLDVADAQQLLVDRGGAELRQVARELIDVARAPRAAELAAAQELGPLSFGAALAWALDGAPELAAAALTEHLLERPASDGPLAEGLSVRLDTLDGALLDRLFARTALALGPAAEGDPAPFGTSPQAGLQRLTLRLGRADEALQQRLVDGADGERPRDPRLLAALVAGPAGEAAELALSARAALEFQAPLPRPSETLRALERALVEAQRALLAAGEDRRALGFERELRSRAKLAEQHPLAGWVRAGGWPPPAEDELLELDALLPGLR